MSNIDWALLGGAVVAWFALWAVLGLRSGARKASAKFTRQRNIVGCTCIVAPDESSIRCLMCGHVSHHPADVRNLFCGFCHLFHDATGRVRNFEPLP